MAEFMGKSWQRAALMPLRAAHRTTFSQTLEAFAFGAERDPASATACARPRDAGRAWLRVIWRAWVDRKPYDPSRHHAAQLLLNTAGG
jgi:hypothetical protein